MDGVDLTAFVLGSSIERARKVIADHAVISLTKKGQMALVDLNVCDSRSLGTN